MVCYGRPPRRSGRRGDGPSVGAVITAEGIFIWKGDSTAKRVLYRRDRRVRRAILKKISALSAFSAMSFCSELKGVIQSIPQKEQFVKRGRTGILLSVRRSSAPPLLCSSAFPLPCPSAPLLLAPCALRLATRDLCHASCDLRVRARNASRNLTQRRKNTKKASVSPCLCVRKTLYDVVSGPLDPRFSHIVRHPEGVLGNTIVIVWRFYHPFPGGSNPLRFGR